MFNTTLTPCFPQDDSESHCNSGWGTRSAGTDGRTEQEYATELEHACKTACCTFLRWFNGKAFDIYLQKRDAV